MSDRALLRLLVLAAALAAFAPALSAGFVGWDDKLFILDNPTIAGLNAAHLRAMSQSVLGGVWIPLTWLSYALDRSLWGSEPAGYHLTSLLLHAVTAVLFYEVCLLLLKRSVPAVKVNAAASAALAAIFFAVHPLRVESVVWAAERKGVLAGALWLAALYSHLAAEPPRRRRLWRMASLSAFALSLIAKPNGLTLPLVLIILETMLFRRRPPVRTIAPYFALSTAALVATLMAGQSADATTHLHAPGAAWGAGQALYGLLFYPWKTLFPLGLAAYYPPKPWFGHWSWEFAACAAVVAAAIAALLTARNRFRPAVVAAACYAVVVLPTLGLVQHGLLFSAADRYSYLSCLGFAGLFGVAFGSGGALRRVAAAVWLAALGTATWRQSSIWHDSLSLWTATASRAPSALADGEIGAALLEAGRDKEAYERLTRVVASGAAQPVAFVNLGVVLQRLGRDDEAREVWRKGLTGVGYSPDAAALLGASLAKKSGRTDQEGVGYLLGAVLKNPAHVDWKVDLGDALALGGKFDAAQKEYEAALAARPGYGRAHNNLGLLIERAGRRHEARAHYRRALIDPESRAQANHNLGNQSLTDGRTAEAEHHFREAVRIDPGLAASRVNLGNILARQGRLAEAASMYRAALKTNPRSVEASVNLKAVTR